MKIGYANENYAKSGVTGMNYFMALMMTTFYIVLTGFMLLFVLLAAYPSLYNHYVNAIFPRLHVIPSGVVIIVPIFLLLRLTIKENSLADSTFTKEYVNKAVNYLIGYIFIVVFLIGFLGLNFLRQHR